MPRSSDGDRGSSSFSSSRVLAAVVRAGLLGCRIIASMRTAGGWNPDSATSTAVMLSLEPRWRHWPRRRSQAAAKLSVPASRP